MANAKIFMVNKERDGLVPMVETPYQNEDILQELVARYPDLLPGDQINPDRPRRWLLVKREKGVPDDTNASNRWSLDHLLLDQDAVPTFVECKRSTDTRIRREVVAQMLEYAANGIAYWPADQIRQTASETASSTGSSLDTVVAKLINSVDEADIQAYWDQVESNLQSGIVRLLFVADVIPKELRRLIEFLNDKLEDIEVLAVEIKQFLSADQEAWVPRVIGQSEMARSKKTTTKKASKLDWNSFSQNMLEDIVPFFENVLAEAERRGYLIDYGIQDLIIKFKLPGTGIPRGFLYGRVHELEVNIDQLPLNDSQMSELGEALDSENLRRTASGRMFKIAIEPSDLSTAWDSYLLALDEITPLLSKL